MNGKILAFLAGACLFSLSGMSETENIEIKISAIPELPVKNILSENFNADFEEGLKSWTIAKKTPAQEKKRIELQPRASIVTRSDKGGKSLFLENNGASVYRTLSPKIFVPGKTYIGSCMIFPDERVSLNSVATSGLGFSLTFWNKGYKKAVGLTTRGAGAEKWYKSVGKPFTMPDWAVVGQLTAVLRYSDGSGLIDDIQVMEAYTQLTVSINSKESAIRQVKIMDDCGNIVFDTGLLNDKSKTFLKTMKIETPYVYKVLVITDDGDVASSDYPAPVKKK